jgi:phosphate starvation-inducible PhoH-like protein
MKASKSRAQASRQVILEDNNLVRLLCGEHHRHLRLIQDLTEVNIHARGNALNLSGQEAAVQTVETLIHQLYRLLKQGYALAESDIEPAVKMLLENPGEKLERIYHDGIALPGRRKPITPKSTQQRDYLEAIRNHDLVFAIGPAGTGKTYLAMAMAVHALTQEKVSRIILTRPAVEAGEKLGFLPGDLAEKVNPYLRPLYDALHDMMDFDKAAYLIERDIIEVAPLAFMRGRTLNNSFVILDEAQNTTVMQMKMFLTRLGFDTKTVVTGDITQIDLPGQEVSGLVHARQILSDIQGIRFCYFTERDVVRHPLVQEIIRAYDRSSRSKSSASEEES